MTTPTLERTMERSHLVLERTFNVSPERVFHAFANEAGFAAWWCPGAGVEVTMESFEFREGGTTRTVFAAPNHVFRNHLRYEDIVVGRRIVAAMTMWTDTGETSSVTVLSFDFEPDGNGCRLTLGEHGAFLDGLETADGHRGGLAFMLGSLEEALSRAVQPA